MKIKWFWDQEYATNEIGIQLHPVNQSLAAELTKAIHQEQQLEVIQPANERRQNISLSQVLMIEAMDQLSKVYTTDDQVFYLKGRLKEFEYLQAAGIFRINNSVILNLAEVASFKNGQYARLEVQLKNGQTLTVSRHYAKQIKEASAAFSSR
ncbi:LytTR family DNA-binding domain-containing protein [Enterococcus sp. LJL120]